MEPKKVERAYVTLTLTDVDPHEALYSVYGAMERGGVSFSGIELRVSPEIGEG
jgi:hypothetical protein